MIVALLLIAAFVCFVLATIGVTVRSYTPTHLIAAGLGLWLLTVLIETVRVLSTHSG